MTAETPPEVVLSAEERESIGEHACWNCADRDPWGNVERILTARLAAQAAEHEREVAGLRAINDQMAEVAERNEHRGITAERALADLRAGIKALADDLTAEVNELRADMPPVGASRVAHIYRTAGLSDARDRLRALLATKDRP